MRIRYLAIGRLTDRRQLIGSTHEPGPLSCSSQLRRVGGPRAWIESRFGPATPWQNFTYRHVHGSQSKALATPSMAKIGGSEAVDVAVNDLDVIVPAIR